MGCGTARGAGHRATAGIGALRGAAEERVRPPLLPAAPGGTRCSRLHAQRQERCSQDSAESHRCAAARPHCRAAALGHAGWQPAPPIILAPTATDIAAAPQSGAFSDLRGGGSQAQPGGSPAGAHGCATDGRETDGAGPRGRQSDSAPRPPVSAALSLLAACCLLLLGSARVEQHPPAADASAAARLVARVAAAALFSLTAARD